jgi:hypothetical protein
MTPCLDQSTGNADFPAISDRQRTANAVGQFSGGVDKPFLQLRDSRFQRSHGLFYLRLREARGDVLRAVPVEAHDFDEEEALDFAAEFGLGGDLVGLLLHLRP